jgi:hypothetical protein
LELEDADQSLSPQEFVEPIFEDLSVTDGPVMLAQPPNEVPLVGDLQSAADGLETYHLPKEENDQRPIVPLPVGLPTTDGTVTLPQPSEEVSTVGDLQPPTDEPCHLSKDENDQRPIAAVSPQMPISEFDLESVPVRQLGK